jgi:GH24 family phage-related lysozyme (muramidase)
MKNDIVLKKYIRLVLENDEKYFVRTDLPVKPRNEDEDDWEHNDVRTDLPVMKTSKKDLKKKAAKAKGSFMKKALTIAAAAGLALTPTQKAIINKADNSPNNERARSDANRLVSYLSHVQRPDFVEKYSVDDIMWSKGVNKTELVDFIKHHESFSALPYYDNGNVTIGYGSNIDRNGKTGKESKHPGLESKNKTTREKAIKKAVKLAYSSYGIQANGKTKEASASGLTEAEARNILSKSLNDHIQLLTQNSRWVSNPVIPTDVLFVLYDMSYNIGPAVFSSLFKKAGAHLHNFAKSLQKYEKTDDQVDIIDAVDHLENAIKEIKDSNAYRSGVQARDNYISNNPNAASWKTRYELHVERLSSVMSDLEAQIK